MYMCGGGGGGGGGNTAALQQEKGVVLMVKIYASKLSLKRGRYGSSKAKAFTGLSENEWLSARQICIVTGIGYYSLGRALPRWVSFGYVIRQPIMIAGDYEYHLEPKAKKWLRLANSYLPNYSVFMNELKAWRVVLTDDIVGDLMSMSFRSFVSELDNKIRDFRENGSNNA